MSFDPKDWPATDMGIEHATLKTTRATLPSDSDMRDASWARRRMSSGQMMALATQPGSMYTKALFALSAVDGEDGEHRLAFAWVRAIADAEAVGAKWTSLMGETDRWPDAKARQAAIRALIPDPGPPAWVEIFGESSNLAVFYGERLGEWISHAPESAEAEAVWARVEKTRAGDPVRHWAWVNLPMSNARLAMRMERLLTEAGKPTDVTDLLINRRLTEEQVDHIADFLEAGSTHMAARTDAMARLGSVSARHRKRVVNWMLTTAAKGEEDSQVAAMYFTSYVIDQRLDASGVEFVRQALKFHPSELADIVLMHPDTPDDLAIQALKHYRAGIVGRTTVSSKTLRSPAYQRSGAFRDWLYSHPTIGLANRLLTDARTNEEANRIARIIARFEPSALLEMLEEDDPRIAGKLWPDTLDMINHNGSAQDRVRVLLLWHKTGEPMPERKSAKSKARPRSTRKP